MARRNSRGLIIAGAGVALLLAGTLSAYRTPQPLAIDAAPTVFSAARALEVLKELVGDGVPHPLGSTADARLRDDIVKRLTALGYTTALQTGIACNDFGECGAPTNIVATRGAVTAKDAVMLAAHYDSVPAGPGASDDGVGVANLLEIARALTVLPAPRHPIVLLVTDGEEAGSLGSRPTRRTSPGKASLGGGHHGSARRLRTSPASKRDQPTSGSACLCGNSTLEPITNSLCYVIYRTLPNNTDFTAFKAASYHGCIRHHRRCGSPPHAARPFRERLNPALQHQGAIALERAARAGQLGRLNRPPPIPYLTTCSREP